MKDCWVKMDGLNVFYREAGEGDIPILLLHGGGSDHSGFSWKYTVPALSKSHRVIALDLPGYGKSECPDWDQSPEKNPFQYHIDFISEFLDELGIEKIHIMGLSMGGGIAIGFALQNPERAARLILVDSAGLTKKVPGGYSTYLATRIPMVYELTRWFVFQNRWTVKLGLRRMLLKSQISDDIIDAAWEAVKIVKMHPAWKSYLQHEITAEGFRTTFTDRLGELKMPCLFLHGEKDKLFPSSCSENAHRLLPDSRFYVLKGCSHIPSLEAPARFNMLVQNFLDEAKAEKAGRESIAV